MDDYFGKLNRGNDIRIQTCRGRLQLKRSKLNQEICKGLMIRAGAEKLFKATTSKKMKDNVALELSFVNSNLQLLKEQLSELNSSVEVYQNDNGCHAVPMIPLGLKETKPVDFTEPFKEFIAEHFGEDPGKYEKSIEEFTELRKKALAVERNEEGVHTLMNYYNQLLLVERRFLSSTDKNPGVYFEWYDSLTGVPSCQRHAALEKASVLFNVAAVHTQIGAKQDRTKDGGVDIAVDSFLRAAGLFAHIRNTFGHGPGLDLRSETLDALVLLMMAQAREILFEKLMRNDDVAPKDTPESCLEMGQEAAQLAEAYAEVHEAVTKSPAKDYVPHAWTALVAVKCEHYKSKCHYFVAVALLGRKGALTATVKDMLACIQYADHGKKSTSLDIVVPASYDEQRLLGKSHLREALLLHEEGMRAYRMCRQLRKVDCLREKLRLTHDRFLALYAEVEVEEDFQQVLDPPRIRPSSKYRLSLATPDLSVRSDTPDLFRDLGPLNIFSAKHRWSAPWRLELKRSPGQCYGFGLRGDSPVLVSSVDADSIAERCGLKEGDFVVAVEETGTRWSKHEEVVNMIRQCGDHLRLTTITPVDQNFLKRDARASPSAHSSVSSASSEASAGSGSGASSSVGSRFGGGSLASGKNKRLSWNPFRRTKSDGSGISR